MNWLVLVKEVRLTGKKRDRKKEVDCLPARFLYPNVMGVSPQLR